MPVPKTTEFSRLVEDFGHDPQVAGRALRELLANDTASFYFMAVELLRNYGEDSPGKQYVVTLLWAADLLIEPLLDPLEFSAVQAIRLAQAVCKVEPRLDLVLTRRISGTDPKRNTELAVGELLRALEVLDRISEPQRLTTVLFSLLSHPDARIRSKAVLLAARSGNNSTWIISKLATSEPRVRANAVEGLWEVDTPAAREILWALADDEDNRVAGNALVGLYRLGDARAIALLVRLAESTTARLRNTAVWAMGSTGDPRFMPVLKRMLAAGAEGDKRPLVLAAMRRILQAEERARKAPQFQVRILSVEATLGQPRRVRFVLSSPEAMRLLELRATQVIAHLNGNPVWTYSMQRKLKTEPMVVVFALPCVAECRDSLDPGLLSAVRSCLDTQLPPALWGIVWYHPTADEREAPDPKGGGVNLSRDAAPLRASLARLVDADRVAPDLASAISDLSRVIVTHQQEGHLIALVDPMLDSAPPCHLDTAAFLKTVAGAHAAGIAVHSLVLPDTASALVSALKEAAELSAGQAILAQNVGRLPQACQALYAGVRGCYELCIPPSEVDTPGPVELRLQVYTPEGFGEGTLKWHE
jgi:HEAT repeat protein